ncbi:unnamed protein product [Rotaria sp. Silwood1]|nr:unnamed protein product [Rotaria sp. Silwood1]CAF3652321.1 unnamed protein product [Rotaria sp. Silwood1]
MNNSCQIIIQLLVHGILFIGFDLSPKVVPFVDIDCRDHTNTSYYLNSYALDFFKQSSEASLVNENGLSPGDTYSLLRDLHLILSSVKTSLEVIINNEQKQTTNNDLVIFEPLYRTLSNVQNIFSRKFQRQYLSRNQM